MRSLSRKKFQKEASWKLFQEVSVWETLGLEDWQWEQAITEVVRLGARSPEIW